MQINNSPAQYPLQYSKSGYVGRFAPSPTGPLHFGSLLAAVGSYLQSRTARGSWLIRIEDLDLPRVVPGAADEIIRTLAAFGFEWQGSIEYQSRRREYYAAAIDQLRASHLYACLCSRAQIAALHTESAGGELDELKYFGTCRFAHHSFTAATALRFIVPPGNIAFSDALQGSQIQDVEASTGDFVVRRRDGIYAYHLAVVVDDAAQGVTEVVRGADLLTSTPRHILLQQALRLPLPAYLHLPVALDQAGRKLSKSSQSLAISTLQANTLLWQALQALRQCPPPELYEASTTAIWAWAEANWSLAPLSGQIRCQAPPPTNR